jgi:hypothetical protein
VPDLSLPFKNTKQLASKKKNNETSEKCFILFNIKPPAGRAYAPEGKAKILTAPEEYISHSTG